jgi:hypothetical protein
VGILLLLYDFAVAVDNCGTVEKFWLMIPLIEVLFSVYSFLSFLSRAGSWTWLHSRSFFADHFA